MGDDVPREGAKARKVFVYDVSPWVPMSDPIDLMHLGKLSEELAECGSATARCIIQGIGGSEPSTGELNRCWLEKEIADVLANIDLVVEHFGLDEKAISDRVEFKSSYLKKWHAGYSAAQPLCAPAASREPKEPGDTPCSEEKTR